MGSKFDAKLLAFTATGVTFIVVVLKLLPSMLCIALKKVAEPSLTNPDGHISLFAKAFV